MNLSLSPYLTDHLQCIIGAFCDPLCEEERTTLQNLVDYLGYEDPTIILFGVDGKLQNYDFPLKNGVTVNVIKHSRMVLTHAEAAIADMRAHAILTERAKDYLTCGFSPTEACTELMPRLRDDPELMRFLEPERSREGLLHYLTQLRGGLHEGET